MEGSNQGPFYMYDGGYIVGDKPVIVVTGNYRLGARWRTGGLAWRTLTCVGLCVRAYQAVWVGL